MNTSMNLSQEVFQRKTGLIGHWNSNLTLRPDLTPRNDCMTLEDDLLIKPRSSISRDTFLTKYTLSFLAASCSELVTYPLDLAKTRLQLQGEKAAEEFNRKLITETGMRLEKRGLTGIAVGIVREEGFFKLWHGMTPAIYRHLVYSGCRMTIYEFIREDLLGGRSADGTLPIWKAITCGASAGAIAQFLANPADLVKVQIQMEGRRRLEGLAPRVTGSVDAFVKIIRESGLRGLWAGWAPNVQRAIWVNIGDLATYETAKQFILTHSSLKDNLSTHALASVASGLVAAILGTPADVIKTRIMNQPTDGRGGGLLYKSSIDCVVKSVKAEGIFSLYKGFVPCWLRMGPWSLTFWVTYEELRKLFGVASF